MKNFFLVKSLKWLFLLIAAAIIFMAVLVNVARLVVPVLNQKRDFFQHWAGQALHNPVKIGKIKASWRGFSPVLTFNRVLILNSHTGQPVMHIDELRIGIDWWHSLLNKQLLPDSLEINGADFDVYQSSDGKFSISTLSEGAVQPGKKKSSFPVSSMLMWLFTQSNISINNVNIDWHNAAGNLLAIRHVKLNVINDSLKHQVVGLATIDQMLPTKIKFVINFQDEDFARKAFSFNFYVSAKDVSVDQLFSIRLLKPYLKAYKVHHGSVNFNLWGRFKDSYLQKLQSEVEGNQVGAYLPALKKYFLLNSFSGNSLWTRQRNGWLFLADKLHVKTQGRIWQESHLGLQIINAKQGLPRKEIFNVGYLSLDNFKKFLTDLSLQLQKKSYIRLLSHLSPSGRLQHLFIEHIDNKPLRQSLWLSADFNKLQIHHWQKIPGFSNLNGKFYWSPQQGAVKFTASAPSVFVPDVFSHPFQLSSLSTQVNWYRSSDGWRVSSNAIHLRDKNIKSIGHLKLFFPDKGLARIDLLMGLSLRDAKYTGYYLPDKILSKHLVAWLSSAFPQGHAAGATFILRGPLKDFPYRHHRGRFQIVANLADVSLNYADHWPVIKDTQGNLTFNDDSMGARVDKATIMGVSLKNVVASIPSLHHAVLTVTGDAVGDLSQGFAFLEATPLTVGKEMAPLKMAGPMNLHLKLVIPLHGENQKVKTFGRLQVGSASLNYSDWDIKLSKIKGLIEFTENSLTAKSLQASLFNQPLAIHIVTLPAGFQASDNVIELLLHGKLSIKDLRDRFNSPALHYFDGMTNYFAALKLHSFASKAPNVFTFRSSLQGISLKLPRIFSKPPQRQDSLFLQMKINSSAPLQLAINYNKKLTAILNFNKRLDKFLFARGSVNIGMGSARLPQESGLFVNAKLNSVNWTDWSNLFKNYKSLGKGRSGLNLNFRAANLQIKKLFVFGRYFRGLQLNLRKLKEGFSAEIESAAVDGNIYVPNNYKMSDIVAYFQRFHWPKVKQAVTTEINPQQLPPLDFSSRNFYYGASALGNVHLLIKPVKGGVIFKQIKVTAPLFQVDAVGQWLNKNKSQATHFSGYFSTKDLGGVLRKKKVSNLLEGAKGSANFDLTWPGAPHAINITAATGKVGFRFSNGRIVEVGKGAESDLGFGRLLSLLSLQSLPSRIASGFSGITKKGFSFNTMKGDFSLKNGNATTNDAYIDGSVARIAIKGRIGFKHKDYNMRLGISPYVTSSLPVIAAIAGGPIVGAITWVVNKIVTPGLRKAIRFEYHVVGSWQQPEIEKVTTPERSMLVHQ